MYNIPQQAFDDALQEKEVESEGENEEMEEEIENELEIDDDGPEFVPADTDESEEVKQFSAVQYTICINIYFRTVTVDNGEKLTLTVLLNLMKTLT